MMAKTLQYTGDDYGRGLDFLGQIREIDRAILCKELQRDELKSCLLPGAIRYDKDHIQSSPCNQMEDVMARIDLLDRDIEAMKKDKARFIMDVSDMISLIPSDDEKVILLAFYVGNKRMKAVSDMVNYSLNWTYELRKRGVKHLGEIVREKEKKEKKKKNF